MGLTQEVFAGLTSTGGPEGGGTAFAINGDGTGFTLLHSFRKLGIRPTGNLMQAYDGHLYGMTHEGGAYNAGTVFRMTLEGVITIILHLDSYSANAPFGSLVEGPDGFLYAMSASAGVSDAGTILGTIFKVSPTGEAALVKTFSKAEGYRPYGDLVLGPDGKFYGMASYGGMYNLGTIFSITPEGALTVLHSFDGSPDGGAPNANLTLGDDGNFYGMTSSGNWQQQSGTVFRITPTGAFTVLKSLSMEEGATPYGSLVKFSDGSFYGMTTTGGLNYAGTIFRITADGDFRVVHHLDVVLDGNKPKGHLVVGPDGQLYGTMSSGGDYLSGTIFRMTPDGDLTVLRHLNPDTDGCVTNSLLLASDGNFYGMANDRGPQYNGTVFRITPDGDFTVLEALPGSYQGSTPVNSLVQGQDHCLYGMTQYGGTLANGTIFRLDPNGVFSVLRSLPSPDAQDQVEGSRPLGNLILGRDGYFYGLTPEGGEYRSGTFFRISPEGEYTLLYSFQGPESGHGPWGSLVEGPDEAFYGMTQAGGYGAGVIFRVTAQGDHSVVHILDSYADGSSPRGSLLLGHDGNLYGMTALGGEYNTGTIFRVSPEKDFARLFSFTFHEHGGNPFGDLIQDADGNLYGMTNKGGQWEGGTIFKCSLAGEVTVLHHLSLSDNTGTSPTANLLLGADGSLYGMTPGGGEHYGGTIFKLSPDGTYSVIHSFHAPTQGREPLGSLVTLRPIPGGGQPWGPFPR